MEKRTMKKAEEWLYNIPEIRSCVMVIRRLLRENDKTLFESKDEVIEAMSLKCIASNGMPHAKSIRSKTEAIALSYTEQLIEENMESSTKIQSLRDELMQLENMLHLEEAFVKTLTPRERWFVEQFYYGRTPIVQMAELNVPCSGMVLSRSTLTRIKKEILQRLTRIISSLDEGDTTNIIRLD